MISSIQNTPCYADPLGPPQLATHGVKGNELAWFENYLSDRVQITKVDGALSKPRPLTVGVPQGSILGPLLFIIYINDLPLYINECKVFLYADDTAIMFSAKSYAEIEQALNQDLTNISKWMSANKLTLNASKTKAMTFGTPQKLRHYNDLQIDINDENIETVEEFKYLGMWFDKHLTWKTHIDKMAKKISQKIGVLQRLSTYINETTRNILYNAIVLPHIDYCCPIWCTTAKKYVQRIQILQNRAARITLACKVRDMHVHELYSNLNWMTVEQRATYFKHILMFKCINGMAPEHLTSNITIDSTHSYSTRLNDSNNVRQPSVKIETAKRSFRYSGASSWNSLPDSIKNITNVSTFKQKIKHHILEN